MLGDTRSHPPHQSGGHRRIFAPRGVARSKNRERTGIVQRLKARSKAKKAQRWQVQSLRRWESSTNAKSKDDAMVESPSPWYPSSVETIVGSYGKP